MRKTELLQKFNVGMDKGCRISDSIPFCDHTIYEDYPLLYKVPLRTPK